MHVVSDSYTSFQLFLEHKALLVVTVLQDSLHKPLVEKFLGRFVRLNIFLLLCEFFELILIVYLVSLKIEPLVA